MFEGIGNLTASLGVYERLEISGIEAETILADLPDLDLIEYRQTQVTDAKTGAVSKEVSFVVDYPEKLSPENVQSLATAYGITIKWRRNEYYG